jgi:pimeloyl-ACP methyl ester carboxylesterase
MRSSPVVEPALKYGKMFVNGKRIETLWIPPSQPQMSTIVMLHGGLGCVALWKDLPQRLAQSTGCGVLAYSRYGNGSSQPLEEKRPVSYMHHEGEIVLPELLEKLGISKPLLLGHSDGGSIAIIYAGKFPDRVRALILEAPHVFVEEVSLRGALNAKAEYETSDLRQRLAKYHENVDLTFWGWNDIWLDPRFRSWNIESYLPQIRCPLLMIQGEQDEYGTVAQLDAIRARVPRSEVLVLPDCGHSPDRDEPETVLARMTAFIGELELVS